MRKKARVKAREGRSEPERKRASEEVFKTASEQASMWCACGCEQCRRVRQGHQRVRCGSVTDGPCGSLDVTSFVKCEELPVSQHEGLNP